MSPAPNSCWTHDYDNESLNVISDQFFDGRSYQGPIAVVKFDRRLEYGYYLSVELQSISKETYRYLKAISDQIGNTGSIFETTSYQISGMIQNLEDSEEVVLGCFQVSGVKSKAIFIDEYSGQFGPIDCPRIPITPTRCYNCSEIGVNSSNIKPDFWPK